MSYMVMSGTAVSVTTRTLLGKDLITLAMNGSSVSETRKMTSAAFNALVSDGFSVKVCGDLLPSTSSLGSPIPAMTAAAREWIGLTVTTTLRSAAAAWDTPATEIPSPMIAETTPFIPPPCY
jgi:hypothetical protein